MSRPRNPAKRNVSNLLKLTPAHQDNLQAAATRWGVTRSEAYRTLLIKALEGGFTPRVPPVPPPQESFQLNLSPELDALLVQLLARYPGLTKQDYLTQLLEES
jgi:hypothetical protein